ncbi:ABC transporter F family member 4-like [Octopus bimaculoides]|uniref:ABC transporter F family member 4-like n=1 Tax=Octopus bimaculoides TaxID=37653 RepID=UPI0022E8CD37|nr:ABC transporter F family member 4-like [Octopus bimaculoides]
MGMRTSNVKITKVPPQIDPMWLMAAVLAKKVDEVNILQTIVTEKPYWIGHTVHLLIQGEQTVIEQLPEKIEVGEELFLNVFVEGRKPRCFLCGKLGHIRRNCMENEEDEEEEKEEKEEEEEKEEKDEKKTTNKRKIQSAAQPRVATTTEQRPKKTARREKEEKGIIAVYSKDTELMRDIQLIKTAKKIDNLSEKYNNYDVYEVSNKTQNFTIQTP